MALLIPIIQVELIPLQRTANYRFGSDLQLLTSKLAWLVARYKQPELHWTKGNFKKVHGG